jgi:hypothetical protein
MRPGSLRAECWGWAGLTTLLGFLWLALTVTLSYGGNWTALFCAGSMFPVPPELASQNIYVFSNSPGYDGQFYLYIAHDPFLRRGFEAYIDAPRLRYRRILVPLAAHVLAAGRPTAIPFAYIAVVLMSVTAGAYWVARFASRAGRSAAWGTAFLMVPAVLISLDRMTLDGTLAALTAGFAVYATGERSWKLYLVLLSAALVRETGLILVAAFCASSLLRREYGRALVFATSVLPCLLWACYVGTRTPSWNESVFLTWQPFAPFARAFVHALQYPGLAVPSWLLTLLDRLGLLGALCAFFFSLRGARNAAHDVLKLACLLFTLLAMTHALVVAWQDAYAYNRSFGPLFLLLSLESLAKRNWPETLPVLLPLPRILLQLAAQPWRWAGFST